MKEEDIEKKLESMQMPEPENFVQQQGLKIPLLSYRKSSRAGLWLLIVPFLFAITVILKSEWGIQSVYLNFVNRFFAFIDENAVLTYLIPVIFVGLPLTAMIINLLAICHFYQNKKLKELIVTIKYRPLNILVFLFSFVVLVFYLLPDNLSF